MLYIDGCSYVHGHNEHSFAKTWAYRLKSYEHKNTINHSRTAKSNDSIFADFMNNYHLLKGGDKVIIHWSHSERFIDGLTRDYLIHDNKNFNQQAAWHDNHFRNWYAYLIRTATLMKAVKDLCLAKNITPAFFTVDHFHWFTEVERLTEYKFLDDLTPYVFNWPMAPVKMYHKWDYSIKSQNKEYDTNVFVFYWALTNLPVSTALALEKETGEVAIDPDYKHLNMHGHAIFTEWVEEWLVDRSKNLEYRMSTLKPEAAKCFTDPLAGSGLYIDPGMHWVEGKALSVMQRLAEKNAEFVYE